MSSASSEIRRKNWRTALILLSVALVFGLGSIAQQWIFGG